MGFLSDLKSTVSLSFIFGALFVLLIIFLGDFQGIDFFWIWLLRFLHVVAGIIWVGLLFYFNFVQIPNLNKIPENISLFETILISANDELVENFLNGNIKFNQIHKILFKKHSKQNEIN